VGKNHTRRRQALGSREAIDYSRRRSINLMRDRRPRRRAGEGVTMTGDRPGPLTPAEWKVMRVLWRLGQGAARDVYAETGRLFGWAPTTTKSVLARLVQKGHLAATQIGNSFLYRPAAPPLRTLLRAADDLAEQFLEGTSGPVLAHLVRKADLTPEELDELRALIDRRAEKARHAGRAARKQEG
jgi:predicted transcriptional regulator